MASIATLFVKVLTDRNAYRKAMKDLDNIEKKQKKISKGVEPGKSKTGIKNMVDETELLDKAMGRTFNRITALKTQLSKMRATGMGVTPYWAGRQLKWLDDISGQFSDAGTMKQFRNTEKELKMLEDAVGTYGRNAKTAGRNQAFFNSGFAKFSIIMSGLAATLFVFQEIMQFMRALIAPVMELEKAWSNLALTMKGSREQMEAIFNTARDINLSGMMKTGEAIEKMKALTDAGLETAEAMTVLRGQMQLMEKNQGDLSEIANAFRKTWREFMDTLSPAQMPGGSESGTKALTNQMDKNREATEKLANDNRTWYQKLQDIFKGYDDTLKKVEKYQDKTNSTVSGPRKSVGQSLLEDVQGYKKGQGIDFSEQTLDGPIMTVPLKYMVDGKIFDTLEDLNQYMLYRPQSIAALKKFQSLSGITPQRLDVFRDDQIRMTLEAFEKQVGEGTPLTEIFREYLQNANYKQDIKSLMTNYKMVYEKLGVITDQYYQLQLDKIKRNEKIRARLLGGSPEALKFARQLAAKEEFALKMQSTRASALGRIGAPDVEKVIRKSFEETKIATPAYIKILRQDLEDKLTRLQAVGTPEAKAQAPLIKLKGELEIFKTMKASELGVDEQYVKDSKVLTEQLYRAKEEIILRNRDIYIEANKDTVSATQITNAQLKQLDRERAASFAKLYAAGSSVREGFKAYMYNLQATQQTVAQQWQQRWATMFSGAEESVKGFFFTFFQSETKSLKDAFTSLGNSFKTMLDRMASDFLASEIMRLLFGSMHTAGAGPGLFGAIFGGGGGGGASATTATAPLVGGGLPSGLAEGGPVSANRTYLVGERGPELFVPRQSGQIKNAQQMTTGTADVKVIINNSTGQPAQVTESAGPDQTRNLVVSVGAESINSGGPMAKAIENNYGLRRVGRMV